MNELQMLTEIQEQILKEMDRLNAEMLDMGMVNDRDFYTQEAVLVGKTHGLALAFDIVTEMIKKQKI